MNFQVRPMDPKAVNDENCTGNTSDGNNTWYTLLSNCNLNILSLSLLVHARKYNDTKEDILWASAKNLKVYGHVLKGLLLFLLSLLFRTPNYYNHYHSFLPCGLRGQELIRTQKSWYSLILESTSPSLTSQFTYSLKDIYIVTFFFWGGGGVGYYHHLFHSVFFFFFGFFFNLFLILYFKPY